MESAELERFERGLPVEHSGRCRGVGRGGKAGPLVQTQQETAQLRTVETYEQAVEYLFGRINYELVHGDRYAARDLKLDRMAALLRLLGDPHRRVPAVHVAGTKGKGSTATMIAAALQASGYKVGLFTSPHLEVFEERIRVNGRPLTQGQLVDLVNQIGPYVAEMDRTPGKWRPTYFELATALAWLFFAQQAVDLAVVEVGLGGRLDSTNVCFPEVTLITSISRDHTHLLGDSLADIAREKAGIVKSGVPALVGPLPEEALRVVESVCSVRQADLWRLGREVRVSERTNVQAAASPAEAAASPSELRPLIDVCTPVRTWRAVTVPLRGRHQIDNTALALAALDLLTRRGWRVSVPASVDALSRVECPLRIEEVGGRPRVILDAAHNWASISALADTVCSDRNVRKRVLIYASAKDKDVAGHLRLLLPAFDTVILTQYSGNPRALPVEELVRVARRVSSRPFHWSASPSQAWKMARRFASPDDLICVTGSFFIAAEIRPLVLEDLSASKDTADRQQAPVVGP